MSVVTLDLDWASESAISETLDDLEMKKIPVTIFATHYSPRVVESINQLEVGLHPFFHPNSSHGTTIKEVVETVLKLPHNIPAFRCHRFGSCNESKKALAAAGMKISSNVCTDQAYIPPFRDRFGFIEVPIFLEDGGFLWNRHPLEITDNMTSCFHSSQPHLFLIHPMHYVLNTPYFEYMTQIKNSLSRKQWNTLSKEDLNRLRWKGRGIRDYILELLERSPSFMTLTESLATSPSLETTIAKS